MLGPLQVAPCPVQGDCPYPLGPSVLGDIYVSGSYGDLHAPMNFLSTLKPESTDI